MSASAGGILGGLVDIVLVLSMFGVFRKGEPVLDVVLDAKDTAKKLRSGIDGLSDADKRGKGLSEVDPGISIADVELASKMADALEKAAGGKKN